MLEDFNINGIVRKKDDVVELDFRLANLKSIQGKIEKAPDNAVPKDNTVLANHVPGTPLTPKEKEKLAKENAAASAEAQALAAEHRARDLAEGKGEPVVKEVADALKTKLELNEFEKKEGMMPPVENPLKAKEPKNDESLKDENTPAN